MKTLDETNSADLNKSSEAVVQLQGVTKKFGSTVAVDSVSLAVQKGEIVSLLGPSGCGKTTTLMLIAGFEQPDAGAIFISGMNMRGRRPYERNVGLVFQDYALFPHMTVRDNIAYGLRRRHVDPSEMSERIKSILKMVDLEGYDDRWPKALSGGQQQRVALARALVTKPEVVLLDEPLSALDAKLRQELRAQLKEILGAAGSTTIVVTHDQQEAMTLSDQVVVMSAGRIAQQGSPNQIYCRPKSRFVAEFVGRSNWFSGKLGAELEEGIHAFHSNQGLTLYVSTPSRRDAALYDVCVRPERIEILEKHEASTAFFSHSNVLTGSVVQQDHLGGIVEFLIELDCGVRVCVMDKHVGDQSSKMHKAVRLIFRAADCVPIPSDPI